MKKLLAIASLLLFSTGSQAQDIHFSQFYENSILRNPGLTGIFSGDYKAGVNYRTQWGNISNPFQTVVASVESRLLVNKELHDYLSYGLCISYDHAGSIDFNSIQVIPAINYNKSLYDRHASYLSVGFAGGYIQRSVDPSKMTLDNQWMNGAYVSTAPTGETMSYQKITHYDLSAGVSFNSSAGPNNEVTYYLGGAAYHFTRPRESFNGNEAFIRLNPRFTGSAGINVRITPSIGFSAMGNYTNQSPYQETIFGGLVSYRHLMGERKYFAISAGCFMRVNDAIIPTIKIDYNNYAFTGSYDVTTSSLRPTLNSQGGYEISVYARGKYKRRGDITDQVMCPRFEQEMETVFD